MDMKANLPPPPVEEEEPVILTKKQKKAVARAQAKEKKRLHKLENTKLVLRDQFRRELELSKRQAAKINEAWKEVIHESKIEELKAELRVWFEKMDRNLTSKDEMIESLLEDIDQVHVMHKRAFFSHIKTIDYLNDVFKVLIDVERDMYERQSADLLVTFLNEVKEFEKKEKEMRHHLSNIQINRCLFAEAEVESDFQIYVQRMDERILQEIFRRFDYRDHVLDRMRKKYNSVVDYINELKTSSYDKDQFTKLKHSFKRHRFYEAQIEKMKEYQTKINKIYSDMQREYIQEEMDSQKKIHNLDLEHKYFTRAYERLKREKEHILVLTTDRMKILTFESRKVLKFYKDLLKKGEFLLILIAECRKFQTEKEKILVQPDLELQSLESYQRDFDFSIKSMNLEENLGFSEEDLREHFTKMRFFWKRFSDVAYQNILLERERDELTADNERLVEHFKKIHSREPSAKELQGTLTVTSVQPPNTGGNCP